MRLIEDCLAERILSGDVKEGDVVIMDVDPDGAIAVLAGDKKMRQVGPPLLCGRSLGCRAAAFTCREWAALKVCAKEGCVCQRLRVRRREGSCLAPSRLAHARRCWTPHPRASRKERRRRRAAPALPPCGEVGRFGCGCGSDWRRGTLSVARAGRVSLSLFSCVGLEPGRGSTCGRGRVHARGAAIFSRSPPRCRRRPSARSQRGRHCQARPRGPPHLARHAPRLQAGPGVSWFVRHPALLRP
jgi:ATP-dependent Clp protease ATP-binding subunit ClpC